MTPSVRTARAETAWQLQRCAQLDQELERRRAALRHEQQTQGRALRRETSHLETLSHWHRAAWR